MEEGSGRAERAVAGEVGSPGLWAWKRFAWSWIFLEAGEGLPALQQVLRGRGQGARVGASRGEAGGFPGVLDEAGGRGRRQGGQARSAVGSNENYKVSGPVLVWHVVGAYRSVTQP